MVQALLFGSFSADRQGCVCAPTISGTAQASSSGRAHICATPRALGTSASLAGRSLPNARPCTEIRPCFIRQPLQRRGRQTAVTRAQQSPPDAPKGPSGGREWLQTLLSRFGPMTDKPQNTTVLDFEKPLVELDNRIKEVRRVAEENGVDVSSQIRELEQRAQQLRKDTYTRLTPIQKLQVARHPNRPTFLDIALNISDKFVELHGDRAGYDDPAMVCGLASIDGDTFMFIGQQKGRNTKENIHRNFGMPQPNGYRKALRYMKHADQFGFPIVTFVDTPGAFAGKEAEEKGQGEAIAVNLREMFGFRVPIISVVIGEGGSGGALAIGCSNYTFIMEHSVYYVASPEACAAILWKSREKSKTATEALKITAPDLVNFGIMDAIIPEPLGGAHSNPMAAFPAIKDAIMGIYNSRFADMSEEELQRDRYAKFRKIGHYSDFNIEKGIWEEKRPFSLPKVDDVLKEEPLEPWIPTDEEASMLRDMIARDKKWNKTLQEWRRREGLPELATAGRQDDGNSVVQQRERMLEAARQALQRRLDAGEAEATSQVVKDGPAVHESMLNSTNGVVPKREEGSTVR